MSTVLRHKRSSTQGSSPTTSDIALGELAINTYDGYLFLKKNDGSDSIVTFRPGTSGASQTNVVVDGATGDGTTAAFTLSRIPPNDQSVIAAVNGVVQDVDTYSLSGTTLTFNTAPANGDNLEFRTILTTATDVLLQSYAKYKYSLTSTSSSLTGADDDGQILSYSVGKLNVYQNGVRLIEGDDYTATNGTSITLTTSGESGDIFVVDSFATASIVDNDVFTTGSTTLTTTNANQLVDLWDSTQYRSAKYFITANHATAGYHTTEIVILHDGTNTYISEYGTIYTNASLLTFSSDIQNNMVRLVATATNTNTTIKFQRQTVAI